MEPLAGIRVIDLSRHLAGPYTSTLLGDMGAEIIRVERPGGDDDRRLGFKLINGDAGLFISRVRNKKSMTLDMSSPEGQEVFSRLVKISDVVLENYGVAVRKRLNVSYERLEQVNPRIILASVSPGSIVSPSFISR